MTATLPHLSVIHGDRHDPPDPDPVMAELIDAIRETWYAAGRSDERAEILGSSRPGRSTRSSRPARTEAGPDLRVVPDEARLLMTDAGVAAILDASR